MIKKFLLLNIVLFLLFSAGCWDQLELNESAIPTAIGIDLGKDKQINFSALFAEPMSPEESGSSQMKNIFTTSSDYSVALAARKVLLSLSKIPVWTHIQSMVLGENLAKNGLPLIVDFMIRNPDIPQDTNLFIAVQSPPEELLAQISSTGSGLKQLIKVNEFQLGEYVPITMSDFTYTLMTPGIEPAVPQIMIKEVSGKATIESGGNKNVKEEDNKTKGIVLHGTAVFKGNKMLGSLNETEGRGYRWLNSHTKTGGFLTVKSPLNPQNFVALEVIFFSSKTSPALSGSTLKMHIDINAQLAFYEANGSSGLLTPTMLKEVEKAANLEIIRQINSCIHKSQGVNSDILGWGLKVQEYQPDTWKRLKADWNDVYPCIEFDVKVKTTIIHSYLSNKSLPIR